LATSSGKVLETTPNFLAIVQQDTQSAIGVPSYME